MNSKRYKLLHYVLIILLMFAPLPVVMAAHCDMDDMDAFSGSAVMPGSAIEAHDMSAMLLTDSMSSDLNGDGCCDDLSAKCSISCDLGINVSLILQETPYSPAYNVSFKSASLTLKTLFRELTPPSRPPANLHS